METVSDLRTKTAALHENFIRGISRLREPGDGIVVGLDTDLALVLIYLEEKYASDDVATSRAAYRLIAVQKVVANATYLVAVLTSRSIPDDGKLVVMASGMNLLRLSYNLNEMMHMAQMFVDDVLEMDFDNPPDNGGQGDET